MSNHSSWTYSPRESFSYTTGLKICSDIVNFEGKVTSVTEKYDKNGGLMAFVTMYAEPCTIELIVFSRQYRLHSDLFDRMNWNKTLKVKGEKKNKNTVAFKIGSIVRD